MWLPCAWCVVRSCCICQPNSAWQDSWRPSNYPGASCHAGSCRVQCIPRWAEEWSRLGAATLSFFVGIVKPYSLSTCDKGKQCVTGTAAGAPLKRFFSSHLTHVSLCARVLLAATGDYLLGIAHFWVRVPGLSAPVYHHFLVKIEAQPPFRVLQVCVSTALSGGSCVQ